MKKYLKIRYWVIFPILIISSFGSLLGNYYLHIGGSNAIYLYSGTIPANGQFAWTKVDGDAKEIAVNGKGEMLRIGMDDVIYYSKGWNGTTCGWIKQPGTWAASVAISGDKFVCVGGSNRMYYYSGAVPSTGIIPWIPIDGAAFSVAVNSAGQMVCVGTDYAVWYSSGLVGASGGWKKIFSWTTAKKVALAGNYLYYLGRDNSVIYCGMLPPDANNSINWLSEWSGAVVDAAVSSSGEMLKIDNTTKAISFSPTFSNYDTHFAAWVALPGTLATRVAMATSEGSAPTTVTTPETLYNSVAAVTKTNMLVSTFDVDAFLAQIAQLKASAAYATNATVLAQEQLAIKVKSLRALKAVLSGLSLTDISGISNAFLNQNYISASVEFRK